MANNYGMITQNIFTFTILYLKKGLILLSYFKMYFEGVFYIFEFQIENYYLTQTSCIGTLLIYLGSEI